MGAQWIDGSSSRHKLATDRPSRTWPGSSATACSPLRSASSAIGTPPVKPSRHRWSRSGATCRISVKSTDSMPGRTALSSTAVATHGGGAGGRLSHSSCRRPTSRSATRRQPLHGATSSSVPSASSRTTSAPCSSSSITRTCPWPRLRPSSVCPKGPSSLERTTRESHFEPCLPPRQGPGHRKDVRHDDRRRHRTDPARVVCRGRRASATGERRRGAVRDRDDEATPWSSGEDPALAVDGPPAALDTGTRDHRPHRPGIHHCRQRWGCPASSADAARAQTRSRRANAVGIAPRVQAAAALDRRLVRPALHPDGLGGDRGTVLRLSTVRWGRARRTHIGRA